jgi:hypothetical protein
LRWLALRQGRLDRWRLDMDIATIVLCAPARAARRASAGPHNLGQPRCALPAWHFRRSAFRRIAFWQMVANNLTVPNDVIGRDECGCWIDKDGGTDVLFVSSRAVS